MEEIKKAIDMLRAITGDDPETIKKLAQIDLTLQTAAVHEQEMMEKHAKLVNDYRQLAMSNPVPTPAKFEKADMSDNPPPKPEQKISFEDALQNILAQREKKGI